MAVDDSFEILTPTEIDSVSESGEPDVDDSPTPKKIRKLCACGCGEEITGNRALKRGHSMGDGLSASVFSGNDILVFQAAFVALISAITNAVENKTGVPKAEPEEAQAIGEPLGRIAARHIPRALLRKMKPGDAADCVLVGTTLTAYIIRITTAPKKAKVEENHVATNGYVNNQTVSGTLNQYEFRPPEQNFQSQNDRTN